MSVNDPRVERTQKHILALKGNQPEMLDRVSSSFTYIKPSSIHTMEGKSHGREERRICSVITNLKNIIDKERWPGLKSLVRIESRVRDIKSGELHKETRYYNAKVSSMGVKEHRKKAGWDNDYLLYALKSFDIIKN